MPKIEESDVLTMLKRELPYYERDDKDDYLYVARKEDLERLAHLIVFMIQTWGDGRMRKQGHKALRVAKGKIETFDPHPETNPTTFFGLKRFRLLSDDDGHKYLIEVGQEKAFEKWLAAGPYWENYEGPEFESLGSHFSTYSFCDPRQI